MFRMIDQALDGTLGHVAFAIGRAQVHAGIDDTVLEFQRTNAARL